MHLVNSFFYRFDQRQGASPSLPQIDRRSGRPLAAETRRAAQACRPKDPKANRRMDYGGPAAESLPDKSRLQPARDIREGGRGGPAAFPALSAPGAEREHSSMPQNRIADGAADVEGAWAAPSGFGTAARDDQLHRRTPSKPAAIDTIIADFGMPALDAPIPPRLASLSHSILVSEAGDRPGPQAGAGVYRAASEPILVTAEASRDSRATSLGVAQPAGHQRALSGERGSNFLAGLFGLGGHGRKTSLPALVSAVAGKSPPLGGEDGEHTKDRPWNPLHPFRRRSRDLAATTSSPPPSTTTSNISSPFPPISPPIPRPISPPTLARSPASEIRFHSVPIITKDTAVEAPPRRSFSRERPTVVEPPERTTSVAAMLPPASPPMPAADLEPHDEPTFPELISRIDKVPTLTRYRRLSVDSERELPSPGPGSVGVLEGRIGVVGNHPGQRDSVIGVVEWVDG